MLPADCEIVLAAYRVYVEFVTRRKHKYVGDTPTDMPVRHNRPRESLGPVLHED